MRKYYATLDMTAKVVTVLFSIIFIFAFIQLYFYKQQDSTLGIIILLFVTTTTFLYKPVYFTIDLEGLHIKKPMSTTTIPLNEIRIADRKYKGELTGGFRILGSGGFLGYLGIFSFTGGIGRVRMLCTNKNNMIFIKTRNRKIVISPEKPDEFLEQLNQLRS